MLYVNGTNGNDTVVVGQRHGNTIINVNGQIIGGQRNPLDSDEITLSLGAGNDSVALPAGTQEVRGRGGVRAFNLPNGVKLIVEDAEHISIAPNTPRSPSRGPLIS